MNARFPVAKMVSATFGCSRSRASDSRQRLNLNRIRRSPARRGAVIGMAWTSPFSVLSTAIVLSGQSGNGLRFLHCCLEPTRIGLSLRSAASVCWSRFSCARTSSGGDDAGGEVHLRHQPAAEQVKATALGFHQLRLRAYLLWSERTQQPERWSLEETFHIPAADQRDVIAELCATEIKQKMSMAVLLLGHGDEHPRSRYVPVLAILSFSSAKCAS